GCDFVPGYPDRRLCCSQMARGRLLYGLLLYRRGRLDEAIPELLRAREDKDTAFAAGISRYGVAKLKANSDRNELERMVEKPAPDDAHSNLAQLGRFVLSHAIIDILQQLKTGQGGELWLAADRAPSASRGTWDRVRRGWCQEPSFFRMSSPQAWDVGCQRPCQGGS
ncbi:MAG: hypothetical protein K6U08_09700, partial [Firmicutes bacterium]|nr:hypothetical protein [Bacillota bacterium]